VEFNRDYFKGYVTDFNSILASPARWDASDWITATVITGAAVGLYDNDAKIQTWVQDHKTTTANNIGDDVTGLGHGKYTPALLGGMYLYGHVAGDGKARKTALLSVESFVLTGIFAFAVATVIASEYDNAVVPPLAYGVATITALNRVMHNAHWSSDTFVGAAIGYFTGKAIVASHRGRDNRLSLAPMMEESNIGVILTYTF
jgi:hypothetical protein